MLIPSIIVRLCSIWSSRQNWRLQAKLPNLHSRFGRRCHAREKAGEFHETPFIPVVRRNPDNELKLQAEECGGGTGGR
jgi:hypothetical protein